MTTQTNQTNLIELYGHVDSVVYAKESFLILRFWDEKRGHLLISTKDKDAIPLNLFFKKLILKVELKGSEFKKPNGKMSTTNSLFIREVEVKS